MESSLQISFGSSDGLNCAPHKTYVLNGTVFGNKVFKGEVQVR